MPRRLRRPAVLLSLSLLAMSLACASQPTRRGVAEPPTIVRVVSTSYLLIGARVVVVDPGPPGGTRRLLRALRRHGHGPGDVALIVVTNGHVDHTGAAEELRARTGAPIVAGAASRVDGDLGFVPDLHIAQDHDLHPLGLPARLIVAPGSLRLALDDGRTIGGAK